MHNTAQIRKSDGQCIAVTQTTGALVATADVEMLPLAFNDVTKVGSTWDGVSWTAPKEVTPSPNVGGSDVLSLLLSKGLITDTEYNDTIAGD
jgi:hypothetical protein|tara:strand:+ start:1031 stop:1306 length:276 start_codon:yes stop_codon:yes gene_type:complete